MQSSLYCFVLFQCFYPFILQRYLSILNYKSFKLKKKKMLCECLMLTNICNYCISRISRYCWVLASRKKIFRVKFPLTFYARTGMIQAHHVYVESTVSTSFQRGIHAVCLYSLNWTSGFRITRDYRNGLELLQLHKTHWLFSHISFNKIF